VAVHRCKRGSCAAVKGGRAVVDRRARKKMWEIKEGVVSIDGHLARPTQPGPSTMRPRHEAAEPDVARQTSCSCWAALWAEIIAQH
jgi:hypothetical protein